MAIAAIECSVGELRGSLHFGLLLSTLLPVRAKLTRGGTERATVEEDARGAPSSVMAANLELEAVLGNVTMPLNAIGALKPGAAGNYQPDAAQVSQAVGRALRGGMP